MDGDAYTAESDPVTLEYGIRNAPQTNLGAAYVFDKHGFISVDYNFMPIKWTNSGTEDLQYLKADVKDFLRNRHQFRIGAEVRLVDLYLRGGYSLLTNPYRIQFQDGTQTNIAFGLGYRKNKFTFDISYSIRQHEFEYFPYINAPVESISQTFTNKPLIFSLAFRL